MIKTIIGIILLLVPLLSINFFKDKKKGFFYVLTLLIFFHVFVALLTQFFGIFSYTLVLVINIVFCIGVLTKTNWRSLKPNIKGKIDWIFIFVVIVLFIELFSVHYNYSGKIVNINGVEEAKNMKYVYPYYSDEWSAISFIKYSINSGKLPFVNPLWYNSYFPNPEFVFHSFLSELFLLLNLNPLTNYSLFALFFGILICLFVYFVLNLNKIGRFPSAVAALSIPYIVNSANLPGIWYLIPLILGIICLLLSFIFISLKETKMVLFTSFLTLIFYPPLFVLSFASLMFYILSLEFDKKDKMKYIIIYILICFIVSIIISFKIIFGGSEGFDFFNYLFSKIYYLTFTSEAIPDYSLWKVVPLWSGIFAVLGFLSLIKEKELWKKSWLIAPIVVGLIYWGLYSSVFWRFIIEYQRVVVATSVLIVIFSGFGIQYSLNFIKNKFVINNKVLTFIFAIVLILFLLFSFFYTARDNWASLKLYSNGKKISDPAPPANNYLIEEDLVLFKDIKNRSFIAPSWKGLVIGSATGNYPLDSKQSTITNYLLDYNNFINSNCNLKIQLAKNYGVDYAYSKEFECEKFELIGK
ncbi:MAG: hypothetical protein PHF67_05190, partial [Candidatus Nanoarchaeia archaeon]|nr:hypothetical protein [Candidatus Nanoarchaeia archaeon]